MKSETLRINKTPLYVHIVLILVSLACLIPFLLLFMSSITDETELLQNGYSFFPKHLSFEAYVYLWKSRKAISRAYLITIGVTGIGTLLSLAATSTLAYSISQKGFKLARFFSVCVIFASMFHPGLVPTYIIYTQYLKIKNTFLALVFPRLFLTGMNVLIMRTFFKNSVSQSLIEAARLDGASELQVFTRVVLPVSKPMLATIGFLTAVNYWNDWYNSFIYVTDTTKVSIQGLLNRILMDIQFLSSSEFVGDMATINIPSVSIRMAIAVVAIIPVFIAFPFFHKYIVKGISIGAVKG